VTLAQAYPVSLAVSQSAFVLQMVTFGYGVAVTFFPPMVIVLSAAILTDGMHSFVYDLSVALSRTA